jgi:2-dehydro-3-deoxyphosphooctonate aldolase (KDO 8-P synthase)
LVIIAGPCVLETPAIHRAIGETVAEACAQAGLPWIFKGSFDKANRTSKASPRGPGMTEGLDLLQEAGALFDVPTTTDVHQPDQAQTVADAVDLLQIPAFLCRQTDLLSACGATGRTVNIKKGQFLSPAEMQHAAQKVLQAGAGGLMLTERGTFFGYHRLVNDFIGMGDLMDLGWPVCFDATHSTQLPGGGGTTSAGRPERAALLARAAVAAGVHALFIECHPDPSLAHSDGATVQDLPATAAIIHEAAAIRSALTEVNA